MATRVVFEKPVFMKGPSEKRASLKTFAKAHLETLKFQSEILAMVELPRSLKSLKFLIWENVSGGSCLQLHVCYGLLNEFDHLASKIRHTLSQTRGKESECDLNSCNHQNSGNGSNLKDMRRRRDLCFSSALPSRSLLKPTDKTITSSPSSLHSEVGGCTQRTYQVRTKQATKTSQTPERSEKTRSSKHEDPNDQRNVLSPDTANPNGHSIFLKSRIKKVDREVAGNESSITLPREKIFQDSGCPIFTKWRVQFPKFRFRDSFPGFQQMLVYDFQAGTMFTNLAHIFLYTCPPAKEEDLDLTDKIQKVMVDFVGQQITLCTLILDTIIQPLTQLNALNTESWEKLLFTLMHIISEVMSKIYQTDNFDSHWVSNDKLLGKMFQTLNASCIYATLAAPIPSTTWDKFLSIYSRLPDCPALFREWKKAMDFLTRQLGKIVFGVDLTHLPDESKTNRGRRGLGKAGMNSQSSGAPRLITLKEKRFSDDNKAVSCPTNSLGSRIPDKPRVDTLDSPGSNEPNSRVDFSLTLGSDEADGVSSDGGAEYLSATDGVEVRNSFDCDSSDIDFYIMQGNRQANHMGCA
ncbi:hypothetical protein ACTXT7_007149 [Hymenolepis weldensis]